MTTMRFALLSLTTILMIKWTTKTHFRKNCRFSTIKTTSCSHPWSITKWLINIQLPMAHKWQRAITWLIVRCKMAIVSRTWHLAEEISIISNTSMHQVVRPVTDEMCKQLCAQQLQIMWPMTMEELMRMPHLWCQRLAGPCHSRVSNLINYAKFWAEKFREFARKVTSRPKTCTSSMRWSWQR